MKMPTLSAHSRAFALCLIVAAAACIRPMTDFLQNYGDTDDAMRLVEARALLEGRGWWHLNEPRLAPPMGLDVHWSRLVDAPIALLLGVFSALFGPSWGETITRFVWPLLLFAPAAFLWIRCAQKLGGSIAMWTAAVLAPLCFTVWSQFIPGRLDHHNVQILLMAVMMYAALDAGRPRNAAIIGGACALSLAVGFESLPVVVWAAGLIALRFAWDKQHARAAQAFGLALAGVSACAFLVQTPPSWWTRTGCDALAFNGAAAAAIAGAALAAAARFSPDNRAFRFAGAGAAGLAGAILFVAMHPSCLHGPYGDLDPKLVPVWLDRVGEARSLFDVFYAQPTLGIASGLLPLAALTGAIVAIVRGRREPAHLALAGLLALTALVGLIQSRGMVMATAAAIPLAAVLLAQFRPVQTMRPMMAGLALGLATGPSVTLLALGALSPPQLRAHEKNSVLDEDKCFERVAFADMKRLPQGLVFADLDSGPHILVNTKHSAASAPYHRLQQPIYDAMTVFYAPADQAPAVIARSGADYIALCRSGVFAQQVHPGSFAEQLLRTGAPAWLKPLNGKNGVYALFSVDRQALDRLGRVAENAPSAPKRPAGG